MRAVNPRRPLDPRNIWGYSLLIGLKSQATSYLEHLRVCQAEVSLGDSGTIGREENLKPVVRAP
jgi:hypothetical protein